MAKNKKGGSIEITVTDKGSLQKLGRNAKRTGKDIGSVAKNVSESDRRLKSMSGQTSGASKAFSKQAQTISGGLVPIYATLAAQVFAVSAAFRFLQEASDFKNLIAGQEAYGAFTGTMYKKISTDIRAATNAQISYAEASQAAAIGISSGLNANQLTQLGTAAANVSLILGRDVTDSFNRLIRGVTKAEPELLDELGIVLRLDPALRNYAAGLNKTKEELNAFERSQAVAAEVIGQAEEKFGGVQAIMDPTAFAFNQFAQAFNDLLDDLKVGLGGLAQTVLPFFTKNVGALIGALGLFALPIIKQLLPNFKALEAQSKSTIASISTDIKTLNRETKTLDIASAVAGGDKSKLKTLRSSSLKGLSGMGLSQQALSDADGKINQRKLAAFRVSAEKKQGIARNMNKKELKQLKMHLRNLEIAEKASLNKRQRANTAHELQKRQEMKKTQLRHAQLQQMMTKATQAGAAAMNMAFKAMGFLGLGLMIFDFGRMGIEALIGVDEEAEKLDKKMQAITESTDQSTESLKKMAKLREDGLLPLTQQANQLAGALQGISLGTRMGQLSEIMDGLTVKTVTTGGTSNAPIQAFGKGSAFNSAVVAETTTTIFDGKTEEELKALEGIKEEFLSLSEITSGQFKTDLLKAFNLLDEGKPITKDLSASLVEQANAFIQLNGKAKAYAQTSKKVTEAQSSFLLQFAPSTKTGQALTAFEANMDSLDARMKQNQATFDEFKDKNMFEVTDPTGRKTGQTAFKDNADVEEFNRLQKALEDDDAEFKSNERIRDVLKVQRNTEREILLTTAQTAAKKAAILQDGSVISAQLNHQVKQEEITLKIKKAQLDIDTAEKILNEANLEIGSERQLNAENSKQIAQQKLAQLQSELGLTERLLFMDKARADLELRKKTGGAGMFGLFGKPTADQIGVTMETMGMSEEQAIKFIQQFNMEMKIANMELDTMEKMGTSVGNALTDGLANAFVNVAKGTTTFADAFRNMTIKILADIAAMTMKMAIFNMIAGFMSSGAPMGVKGSALPANFGSEFSGIKIQGGSGGFTGPVDFSDAVFGRSGGIMSSPGYRSYARGGVAMGPDSGYAATLHGTEAVVPLGNDRSIPVKLKGAGGGVNNITVNVNGGTEGGGQSPEQGKALGQMIQVATMEIIQREKRPGGVLSR